MNQEIKNYEYIQCPKMQKTGVSKSLDLNFWQRLKIFRSGLVCNVKEIRTVIASGPKTMKLWVCTAILEQVIQTGSAGAASFMTTKESGSARLAMKNYHMFVKLKQ
ncbi:unnamed protein product [Caenorhabditis nigoni]